MDTGKVWDGRFSKKTAPEMEEFSYSVDVDVRLFREDLLVNRAWAKELKKIGILTKEETNEIIIALNKVEDNFRKGDFTLRPGDEDIHTTIERQLIELNSDLGGKLYTGRSRNDQIMTDLLLYFKRVIPEIISNLEKLEEGIIHVAEDNLDLIICGYTHLQPAQPILFCHFLLSLFWLLERDKKRLISVEERCNIMPLGSGALGGSGFAIDRIALAETLGFGKPSHNSLDITSHRDIPTEVAFILTIISNHLSRYAADFIIWSSREFRFITLDEAYTTGSSIMPQKKNPDSLELIRGKAASAVGHITGLLCLSQGLPHAYNRDLQQDKTHLFEIIDITKSTLKIFTGVLKTLQINTKDISSSLYPELLATEIADYLTKRGINFRKAHKTTGKIVSWAERNGIPLNEIPIDKLKEFSSDFDDDIYQWLNFENALKRRNLYGGTGPSAVKEQLKAAKEAIKE